MPLGRNKLYFFLSIACLAGYAWLIFNTFTESSSNHNFRVCIFKQITSIPCPSCGSTRSLVSLFNGDFKGAFYWNPLGIVLLGALIIAPIWIGLDLISKKDTLLRFYEKFESTLKQKKVAIPLILLIIINWIWNIYKGL